MTDHRRDESIPFEKVLVLCALGFLLGVLFGCQPPTGPCADSTMRTDTIGWVLRSTGDSLPITATAPTCIGLA